MALVKHHSLSPLCSKLRRDHLTFHSSHLAASFSAGKPFRLPETSRISSWRRQRMAKQAAASLGGFFGGIFKGTDTGESTRQQYAQTVALINGLEAQMAKLSDDELREKTLQFQERAKQGESLDSLLPEAFAVIREASRRVLGLRPFDVQLIGTQGRSQDCRMRWHGPSQGGNSGNEDWRRKDPCWYITSLFECTNGKGSSCCYRQ